MRGHCWWGVTVGGGSLLVGVTVGGSLLVGSLLAGSLLVGVTVGEESLLVGSLLVGGHCW